MEIFDKITKQVVRTYTSATEKTSKLTEETRIRIKISNLRGKVYDLYEEIGEKVYESHILEDKNNILDKILSDCEKIDEVNNNIKELERKILEINSKKKCKNCFVEIKITDNYCFNCGELQKLKTTDSDIAKTIQIESNVGKTKEKDIDTRFTEKDVKELENIVRIESNVEEEKEK